MSECTTVDIEYADPVRILAGLASLLKIFYMQSDNAINETGKSTLVDSDREDVKRSQKGDGDAFRHLIEKHQSSISSRMWRFSRDPLVHEELVQDVFIEVYKSLGTYRFKAPFSHWLARIATRIGYRYWKKMARQRSNPTVPLEEWDGIREERIDELDPEAAADLLHRLLAMLPPRDRLVLTLRYIEDHSIEETARMAGWSRSMTKVQIWRAKKKLKKLFEEHSEEREQ